jgi:hypothetical protein
MNPTPREFASVRHYLRYAQDKIDQANELQSLTNADCLLSDAIKAVADAVWMLAEKAEPQKEAK